MGFFNKKENWWDEKANKLNPLMSSEEITAKEEFYRMEMEKKRLQNQQMMNKQMYGTASAPNGLYNIQPGQVQTGHYPAFRFFDDEVILKSQPYIDFFSRILATRPDIVI